MDWWTGSSSSSSTATAAAAAAAAAASAAVVANDIGLPTGGFQHESNAFFDPWLNVGCDELDLSIILSHHHVHPHHNATPSSLHQMSPFCDSNNNNNNPSSPQTTTCSMINHTSSNNNNNNNSTTSSQLDQNPISKLQNIATETQSSHQQYRASINKNNGSLASSSTTFSSTSSSSNTTTTTSSSTSPDASSSLASALVDHSNHDDTCAGNRHQHIQQHHQQDKSIPCLLNDNNNDLSDGQMFSSSANDCKPLMSFGLNNKQPINHHNNRINPIFTNNNNNSSKQILKTNYNGRTATIGNNNQQSYLNCQTSVASPITSSPVSSSIELSPQNSVEISTTGTSNACYLLGSNYSRPNVLSPISPSSMIISHQHNDQQGMQLVRGDIGQQSESTRLLEGSFKVNLMHQNHSQPFEETSYCENQSLFRKSSCDSGEVQPYFNSNNRCHIGSLDTNECGCALGIASENNGSRQRIRNNLENLLHLASGTDDESNLKIRLDCSGLKVDSHQQAEIQNNQQLSSALTPSHMHNEEQLGRGSSHTDDNGCHNARAQQNTTTRNNSMTQVENSRNNKTTTQSGGQKGSRLRRFRHITDYVLAEEEKRLLIKEGYTDFPMTSSPTRPLSRAEERILRKIRRKIRNKKSAQCSRQRKKEYVEELERKYTVVVRENEELKQLLKRFQQHAN